ncbi:TonB-dependent receptor [Parendozoicomonas haliclonae]|uniref:Ferric aerobactin receptor n=1 Tax=Parendozoicomonas haliclonae TaxID=1960125 RepID=A0A1X7ARH4_9GAMM|nr:TonB-dependent receptor [Parendozoicomonas haliclonae]SMA50921.1 Ferric aerobactin receptor precursor [Parendozoicomonas haliclonae]
MKGPQRTAPTRLALAIGLTITGSALSSSLLADITQLDKVVVTATRTAANLSSISGTVQVIEGQQIAAQASSGEKLSDILEKLVPGMGPSTQTVTDRTQSIRGRKVLVLIDGISQQDNRQISRQMNTIRPENIARVEVVSGASAIYGGGATGGIINIITKKPEQGRLQFTSEAGLKISSSELNAYTLHQSISGREGGLDFLLSGTFEQRDSIFDADGHRVGPDPSQVSRSDTETKDVLARLGFDINESQRIEASAQIFRDEMDTDYGPNYGDNLSNLADKTTPISEPIKGLKLSSQPYTDRDSLSFRFIDEDVFGSRLEAQAYYRTREARFYPYAYDFRASLDAALRMPGANLLVDDDVVVNQSTSKSEVYGVKLVLDTEVNDNLRLSYGVDYDVDKGEQTAQSFDDEVFVASNGLDLQPVGETYDYGPDVTAKTLGLFIQGSYEIQDNLTFNAGFRHERASLDISDYNPIAETWFLPIYTQAVFAPLLGGRPLPDIRTPLQGDTKKYTANLANGGLVYRLDDNQEVFANYSEGFEVPDAARILRNAYSESSILAALPAAFVPGATATDVNDANLDAIKIKSYELGWRGHFENFESNVTAFYNESDKTIDFNADFSVDLLDQKKKVYGIEAVGEFYLNDNWSLGGSYAFTEGRSYYADIGKWLDLQAADVSPEKITAHVSYEQDGLDIRLQATTFADYDKGRKTSRGQVVAVEVDGYTTVDLMAAVELPVGVLSAGISNLLNEDYETVYSQWARQTYDGLSAHKAEGRAYTLSYRIDY